MTTGFFQFFNSKTQSNASKKARSGRDRSPLKPRRLLTETLEERQLLAVDALGASALLATSGTANVVVITSSDYSIDAIKTAIQTASLTPEDDVIRVPAGSLVFSSPSDEIEINYDADAFGKITIEAVGGQASIDANGLGRVFTIKNGDLTLDSISITGGSAEYGGAIANAGVLTLKNVELTNNSASVSGGAIANKGVLKIQDSVITGNRAATDGAAVYDGDFEWPTVAAPEWIFQIPKQVGEKDGTITLDLSEFASAGAWTYDFVCSNPEADIFSAEPTLVGSVLTLKFIGDDAYASELDLSAVEFTVVVSDGTTTDAQTFTAVHKDQAAVSISAVLSNKTYDEVAEEYGQTHKQGKKTIFDGMEAETIPGTQIVDLSSDDLYVQIWSSDHCYEDQDYELAWNGGDFSIVGYVVALQLTNAVVVESQYETPGSDPSADPFARDAYTLEDLGDGKYIVYPTFSNGAPFGYDDAMMLDMLKIQAIDPTKPVSVELFQYTTDSSRPSAMRMYDRTPAPVNPSQILYSGAISNSTDPYNAHMGQTYDVVSSADETSSEVDDLALNTSNSNYATTISNSLIAGNAGAGSGAVYVGTGRSAQIYNATIAKNTVGGAAVYVGGTVYVANSIVVNDVAPFSSDVSGSNNLVNATIGGSVTFDSGKPLFESDDSFALAVGSQAANIGSADYALDVDGNALTVDLAGNARYSSEVDAGAYEYQGSAPSVPATLEVSDYVDSSKNPTLTWSASEATDGVDGYYVYCGDALIGTVTTTSLANLASLVELSDNSSYTFKVSAFNVYGESPRRNVILDTTVVPEAPTGLAFGDYADGSATLTWNGVSNAVSYVVRIVNVDSGEVFAQDVSETSFTFTGLSDFTNYSATVTAVNSRGEAESAAEILNTTVAPAIPTGLTATAYTGDGTTTLVWNPVDHAAGYKFAQKIDESWVVVDSSTSTSRFVEGLVDNSTYTFGVAAYAVKDGVELLSDYAEVVVYTTVAPDKPTNLEWIGGYSDHSATLQWTASEGAAGYRLAISQNGVWTVVDETNGVNYAFRNLTDNQELVFGVAAYSTLGTEKLYSDYAQIDLNTVVAPAVPKDVRFAAYSGGTSATLTWSASVGGATGYNVERYAGGEWEFVGTTDQTSYAVVVEENSYYAYRVVAFNQVGARTASSAPSKEANLDTLVPPRGDITVVASGYDYSTGVAALTWTNLDHASYYVVEQRSGDETEYTIVDPNVAAGTEATTSYSLTGLSPHTS